MNANSLVRTRKFCLMAFAMASLLIPQSWAEAPAVKREESASPKTTEVALDGHRITVEVADTEASREKGLSGRVSISPNTGMLFVFDTQEPQSFWMKNTHFDLDLAFFDAGARLIEYTQLQAGDERIYTSRLPVLYVLELPVGWLDSHNIELGDQLTLFESTAVGNSTHLLPH